MNKLIISSLSYYFACGYNNNSRYLTYMTFKKLAVIRTIISNVLNKNNITYNYIIMYC